MNTKQKMITGLVLAAVVCCMPLSIASGQIGDFLDPAASNASAKLYTRLEGDTIKAVIKVKVDSGWHLYDDELGHAKAIGRPTVITLSPESGKWSKVLFPKPHRLPQKIAGPDVWINSHDGEILLYAVGKVSAGADPGAVSAEIDGQTCSDGGACVLYKESIKSLGRGDDSLFAAFPDKIAAAGAAKSKPTVQTDPDDKTDYASIKFSDYSPRDGGAGGHSMPVWLALAFLAGILMNVMPCVLPMISIKVLSFVQQAGESRGRVIALGALFALGIMLVFWALAIAAIMLGLSWGEQFQSDTFVVVVIAVLFAFALSLLGVFTLGVPKQVNTLAAGAGREGLGNALFSGMLATVLATPCSGPYLGSTLTWALAQTPPTIFLVFTVFGLGMALPYVILTAFPKLLAFVPKPGPWMETFKHAMGFLLLATVVYLMRSVKAEMLLYVNAFLVFVGIAVWYWGRFAKFGQAPVKRWTVAGMTIAIMALGAQLSFGTMRSAFAPPEPGQGHVEWIDFDPELFKEHIESGRPVFIDFAATWCSNCTWNEKMVFESDEISELLKKKGVVSMRADITHDSPKSRMIERLRAKLGGRALPYLAVFPPDKPGEPFVRPDIVTIATMREILNSLPDPKPAE